MLLVHICCSVDSHYFLQKMQQEYPGQKILGYFYNPNIHPLSEYNLRLMDVTRSCDMLQIPLIVGQYNYEKWYQSTKKLVKEPEKGKRCDLCFVERFEQTAKKAKELGIKTFTSTLGVSPKKSLQQLQKSGEKIAKKEGVSFILPNLKEKGGTSEQNRLAKVDKLYRQNYCGCLYALKEQRTNNDKPAYELFNSIEYTNEPNSLENKTALYEKRLDLETRGRGYEIVKVKKLNYRLLRGVVKDANGVVPSFILPYSVIQKGYSRGRVEKVLDDIAYFNRDEIKFCDITHFNAILGTNFYSVTQLIRQRLDFELLLKVRRHIVSEYDMSPVIITNTIPTQKLKIEIDARYFLDTSEELRVHAAS